MAAGASVAAIPHGTNRLAASVSSTVNLNAAAHSIHARYGPEYSRIIASWIIVSSRCVAGLSTGSRPVSAIMAMRNAANASACPGPIAYAGIFKTDPAITPRLVEPVVSASARIATARVGSVSAATVISRLDPMPPNAVPGSRPPSARKNVPSISSAVSTNRSPS